MCLMRSITALFALYKHFPPCYMHTAGRCHMSILNDYRNSIEELTAAAPKKKAALIRSLLPTIEAALRSGQTLNDIWETLRNQGLNMGYHVFQMTLWRARKSKAGTAPGGWEKGTKPSDSLDPQERDVPTSEA